VSRFFKIALAKRRARAADHQIANDGNLLPHPVTLTELDEQGIAERYDIVIDFSKYAIGDKLHLVNLCEHEDGNGKKAKDLSLAEALSGHVADPCVGRFLEFRVVANPRQGPDMSQVPGGADPEPGSVADSGRARAHVRVRPRRQPDDRSIRTTSAPGRGASRTDGGRCSTPTTAGSRRRRSSARARSGTCQRRRRLGSPDSHPLRGGTDPRAQRQPRNVPPWERGRKDVYRLRPGGSVTLTMQFRDWGGMFMEHCHNTVHEDNAMLLRWEINSPIVVLDIDFSNLKGTSGSLKTLTTYVTGENHATELRPLQATDTIIVTCPYFDSSKDALSARSMLVTATLNFDISSGKLASGSISIGNNVITSKEVGTFTAR
jgi:hypothetical protein